MTGDASMFIVVVIITFVMLSITILSSAIAESA